MSVRLGSSWKFLLPRNRHSDPQMSDARTICQNLGGDLAIIRSQDENNFITDLVRNKVTGQSWGAWIGLHKDADGMFYWIDGTPLTGQYSAWASGEPNFVYHKCVHTAIYREGKWNDNTCSFPESSRSNAPIVLCQKKSI